MPKHGKKDVVRDDSPEEEEEEEEDEPGEYEVERIVYRIWSPQDNKMLYCIKWKGFPEENNTFEPKENLSESLQATCDLVEERKIMKKVVTHKPPGAGRGSHNIKYYCVWEGEEGSGSDGEDVYSQQEDEIPEALLDDYWRRARFMKGAARGKILQVKERKKNMMKRRKEEYEREVSDDDISPRKKMKREEEKTKEEKPRKKSRLDVDSEVEDLRRAFESDRPKKESGSAKSKSDKKEGGKVKKKEEEKEKKKKKPSGDGDGREKERRQDEKKSTIEDGRKQKRERIETNGQTTEKRQSDEAEEQKREKIDVETGKEKGSKKNVCVECKGKASSYFKDWCSEVCRWDYLQRLTKTILH